MSGAGNVAAGASSLVTNSTGSNNVAIGKNALSANTTGSRNVALGLNAGANLTTGSDNVAIANAGKAGESGTIRIGNDNKQVATFIAGINTTPLGGAARPVLIKPNGQLGIPNELSPSASSLAATVERLNAQLERQQRQIERLREQVKGD